MTINSFSPMKPALLVLVLLAVFATGCTPPDDELLETPAETTAGPSSRHIQVETTQVEPGTFQDIVELTGAVDALNDVTLSAQSAGTVTYLRAKGQSVARGGLIAQIDSTLAGAAHRQALAQKNVAQAQYDLAADSYKRQEPLFQDSIISAIEFQQVRTQYAQAKAGLSQADAAATQLKEQLDNTQIRAPFSGTVEAHYLETGEQASPGMPVIRIVNTRTVNVQVGVPERYAGDIEAGAAVNVSFDAYSTPAQTGRIAFVGNAINPENRTFPIEIRLENSKNLLKPEMVARVMLVRQTLNEVLVVPRGSIPLDETGSAVFVVMNEGGQSVARRKAVTLGPSFGGEVVVESGLEAGDNVVTAGQNNLSDGDLVEVTRTETGSIAVIE